MPLFIRLSDTDIHMARYDGAPSASFQFDTYHLRPQVSLTMNLREAMKACELLQHPADRVEMLIHTPVTPVPLMEFQEEDCRAIYNYCFTPEKEVRVFYDTVPACNVVLVFALEQLLCNTLEEAFGEVRYSSVQTSVLQYFSGKGLDSSPTRRRLFVYVHEGTADVSVFDADHLQMFNSYTVRAQSDVAYYAFNLAHHLGLDTAEEPIFVAGEELLRTPVVEELQKYAPKVFGINPAADFNRHAVALTPHVPYDLMVKLLAKAGA